MRKLFMYKKQNHAARMRKLFFGLVPTLFLLQSCFSSRITEKIWDGTEMESQLNWSELNIFLPEEADTSGISVIICPGGSYFWLDMDNEGFSVAKYLNKHGITAFVLRYRTAKHGNLHPAMIQDLQRSMQLVKMNSQKYNINPEKIGIMGFSAGGHLVGIESEYFDTDFIGKLNLTEPIKPYFTAMIYPVVSMEDSICHKKSRHNLLGENYSTEMAQTLSLEKHVRRDMSPVFLLHCRGDKTVDFRNSIVLDKALTDNGVKHEFLLLNKNGANCHGFGIKSNGPADWIDRFIEWIRTI
jgi:acetyl esterase/lipase